MPILSFNKPAFGLDISNRSVKFLQILKKGRGFKLGAFGKIELPQGLVEQGRILNPEVLKKYLKELLSKKEGRLSKKVIVSLPETEAFLQVIQMPSMSPKELEKAVIFEAENYIPLPGSEMCLDFEVIRPLKNHLDHTDVFLAAASRKTVDEYLKLLEESELKPLAFETESRAIFRAVIPKETAQAPTLILDFGWTRTNFCIAAGRAVRFSGSIAFSGALIDEKIAKSLKLDIKKAAQVKERYGIADGFEVVSKLKAAETEKGLIQFTSQIISGRKLAEILSPELSLLLQEIRRYLVFYAEHSFHEHLQEAQLGQVKKIMITGGLANLKGLKEFLRSELGLEVELANPWVNLLAPPLKSFPEMEASGSQQYVTAIGLALRGIREEDFGL